MGWFVDAHKWFKGPKVNLEHQMLGREGNVLEGKATDDEEIISADAGSKGSGELADNKV